MKATALHSWPADSLAEAIGLLARRSGAANAEAALLPGPPADARQWEAYVEALAEGVGLEAESIDMRYDDVEDTLRGSAPAILRLEGTSGAEARFLAIVGGKGRHLSVLGPDRAVHRIPLGSVRDELCAALDASAAPTVEKLLAAAGLSDSEKSRRVLLRKQLGGRRVGGLWLLWLPASASFLLQLRDAGVLRWTLRMLGGHALQYALWLIGWSLVGLAALQGRYDGGWLLAWVLLLATIVPLRLLVVHGQGIIAIRAGALLKRRLLAGALKLDIDQVRAQGTGQFLGRVLESNAVETQATTGGLAALVSAVELVAAAAVLALGAGGPLHAALLVAWLVLTGALVREYYRRQSRWADARLRMTHRLVEQMVGHRTRLAQPPAAAWLDAEDRSSESYLEASVVMDRAAARLVTVVPRGWLVAAVALLAQSFVAGTSAAALAVGLGGTLLAYQALRRLSLGLFQLTGAAVAWRQIESLFEAAAGGVQEGSGARPADAHTAGVAGGAALLPRRPLEAGETVLEAHGVGYAYQGSTRKVLDDATLEIRSGDRLLLEGPSGGGKSTLAALLTGLRQSHSGLLLLRGLDPRTLGVRAWRRRVASAPQFHENHVLTGTFAFNLLLGRQWPPSPDDLSEADSLCRALGLGPLLDRMPAGIHQMVGETGWQLSHGERSRLFLARALLQEPDVVVLDESFGALDAENTARSLRCTLERAPTVMLIAHP